MIPLLLVKRHMVAIPMALAELLRRDHPEGMTPQQLRDVIKVEHPPFYGTESHRRNVERGHYQSLDHALLAQLYVAGKAAGIVVDRSQKPLKFFLGSERAEEGVTSEEAIDTENLERLEAGVGTMYVLGTHLYTKDRLEIIKIGITTGSVEARINQLYTTGVPFRLRVIRTLETKNYDHLERALHSLLDLFRINRSREFFTDNCLPHVEQIVAVHEGIQRS